MFIYGKNKLFYCDFSDILESPLGQKKMAICTNIREILPSIARVWQDLLEVTQILSKPNPETSNLAKTDIN